MTSADNTAADTRTTMTSADNTAADTTTNAAWSTDDLIRVMSYTLEMGQCGHGRYPETPSMYTLAVELAYRVKRPDEALIDVVAEILGQLADHLQDVQR